MMHQLNLMCTYALNSSAHETIQAALVCAHILIQAHVAAVVRATWGCKLSNQ